MQKSSWTTAWTALPFYFSPEKKQSSPVHSGRLGLGGPFHLLGPQDEVSLPDDTHHGRSPARPGSLHTVAREANSNRRAARAKSK